MEPLSANNIHRSMGADERLLQLKLQAQVIVQCLVHGVTVEMYQGLMQGTPAGGRSQMQREYS